MADQTVDLTNCDREPIHIPGLIQPHGVLLVLRDPSLEIIQVSGNTQDVIGHPPEDLLGKPLSQLLDDPQIQRIQQCLTEDFESINPLNLSIKHLKHSIDFDGIVHRRDGVVLLELEPKGTTGTPDFFDFYHQVKEPITRIQKAPTLLDESFQAIASGVLALEISKVHRNYILWFRPEGDSNRKLER
jgi:light-regulated signal transduction histidine kinase (bacteriophytochrome)